MQDFTNENENLNLPPQYNDCLNFEASKTAYGCQGIVKKSSPEQYCRRCHEAMTARNHREELVTEFEDRDFDTMSLLGSFANKKDSNS